MTNPLARFPGSGRFTAGLLIGSSIVAAALALTETTSVAWRAWSVVEAAVVLVLGLAPQGLVTPGRERNMGAAKRARPVGAG